jgi:hypothetical protein
MTKLTVKCICGEVFYPEVDLAQYQIENSESGIVPLLLPHKDHFVTAYVDQNGVVRGVERIILVEENVAPQVVSDDMSLEDIQKIADDLTEQVDPNKDYSRFISLLLFQVNNPEALFAAGVYIGLQMWTRWRASILKLGAKYSPQLDLILKSELKPILDKAGETNLHGEKGILIRNCDAPQFVVGLAQGVLNAVSAAAKGDFTIKIEYSIEGNNVMLTVQ